MGVAYYCRDCRADMTEFMPEEIDRLTAEIADDEWDRRYRK